MIANDIEEGKLPLTEEGSKVSWDPLNPYRELDSAIIYIQALFLSHSSSI
jgi:hypothetical protein